MNKLKLYLDTSVINFIFATDAPELQAATIDLFDNFIKPSIYDTFISSFVIFEINRTSDETKKNMLFSIIEDYPIQLLEISEEKEIEFLANQYIQNGIIPINKKLDALHIAVSTIYKIDYLVSWNYKHLANVNKEKRIYAVNIQYNYLHPLRICTPLELLDYGK